MPADGFERVRPSLVMAFGSFPHLYFVVKLLLLYVPKMIRSLSCEI